MKLTSRTRRLINLVLGWANLRLETRTAEALELRRVKALVEKGHFRRPAFPVPDSFKSSEYRVVLQEIKRREGNFAALDDAGANAVGFDFNNGWFGSPDAEVLYAIVAWSRPDRIVEVGSGHSTKLMRQAALDEGICPRIMAIDPEPRTDIEAVADVVERRLVEDLDDLSPFLELRPGDILFVDSSHRLTTGGDVTFLFLEVMPRLAKGVLVHIHDVFLPFDYPEDWVRKGWGWNEQYLVQALLTLGSTFETVWAGRYLQWAVPDVFDQFPRCGGQPAQSLWLRKRT